MASQKIKSFSIAQYAASDLSSKQYYAVKLTSTDDTVDIAGAGQGHGIVINVPATGDLADVVVFGGAKVKLGGTVTRGQYGKADSSGKLVVASTDKDRYLVQFLESGVSGDIVEALVLPGYLAA